MSSQTAFAQALLAPVLDCPVGLTSWNGSDPQARFAVYRNNVTVALIDALADTFPVVQALVGEEFFRAMAGVFARSHPPRSRVMAYYGDAFADFVASFAPAASVPYLADVARLEMARVHACHAADVSPLDPEALRALMADAQQARFPRLVLHPSVQVIASSFAVFSLWAAHQGELDIGSVDPELAQTVLVFRRDLDVHAQELPAAAGVFVRAVQAGDPLTDAAASACDVQQDFDLVSTMALLIRHRLIVGVTIGDRHHDPRH